MEIDLMVPTTYKSEPLISGAIQAYNKQLARIKEPPVSSGYIQEASSKSWKSEGGNTINAEVDSKERLFIDLPFKRKALVYRMFGRGNKLELMAVRDYSIEVGLALHQREIQQRRRGSDLLEQCRKACQAQQRGTCSRPLGTALKWNPFLHEEVAKDRKLTRYLKDYPQLAQILDEARQDAGALETEQAEIAEALKAEEDA